MEQSTTENNTPICINKGRPVYFSYARNSSKNPEWEHISDCVEELLKQFDANNIEYRLDKRDIGTGDKISDFEREIGWKSEVVVLVFSDKYFRSPHCMFEFAQIKQSLVKNPNKRLMCIKSGDFNLSDPKYIMELERFWGDQRQDYEQIEYHRLRKHSGIEVAAFQHGFYMEEVRSLYSFFSTLNYANASNNDWSSFINDIKKYYAQTPVQPKVKTPEKTPNMVVTLPKTSNQVVPSPITPKPSMVVPTPAITINSSPKKTSSKYVNLPILIGASIILLIGSLFILGVCFAVFDDSYVLTRTDFDALPENVTVKKIDNGYRFYQSYISKTQKNVTLHICIYDTDGYKFSNADFDNTIIYKTNPNEKQEFSCSITYDQFPSEIKNGGSFIIVIFVVDDDTDKILAKGKSESITFSW